MDTLLIKQAGQLIAEHALGPEAPLTVGRAEDCQIVLDDASVSPRHAQLTREGDRYWITDLGSATGVFVSGQRVWSARLEPGEPAAVGVFTIEVSVDLLAWDASELFPARPAGGQDLSSGHDWTAAVLAGAAPEERRRSRRLVVGIVVAALSIAIIGGLGLRARGAGSAPARPAGTLLSEHDEARLVTYLEKGRQLLADRRLDEAVGMLARAQQLDPSRVDIRELIAKAEADPPAAETAPAADVERAERTVASSAARGPTEVLKARQRSEPRGLRASERSAPARRQIDDLFDRAHQLAQQGEVYAALVELRKGNTFDAAGSSPWTAERQKLAEELVQQLGNRVARDIAESSRLAAEGRLGQALIRLKAALEIVPAHPEARQAVKSLSERVHMLARARYETGIVLEGMNDLAGAREQWQQGLDLPLAQEDEYYRKLSRKLTGH